MNSNRLPILCAGLLFGFAAVAGQAGCSDSETSTGDTLTGGGGNVGGNTAGAGGIGGVGNNGGGGNGGNMGGGGQGGMIPNGSDTCDGTAVSIGLDDAFSLTGDTTGMADDYSSACEGTSGPDVVYALTVEDAGTLVLSLTGGGDGDPSIYLRATCDQPETQLWCRNGDGVAQSRSFTTHVEPGTYHLFIDTDTATGGQGSPFNLGLALAAGTCPDGATNPGEDCDDGNQDIMDGCDANCMFEAGTLNDCSAALGNVTILNGVGMYTLSGTTLGNDNLYTFVDCGLTDTSTAAGGFDRIHAVRPTVSGTMRLRAGWDDTNMDPSFCAQNPPGAGCWDRVVSVRHAAGMATEMACNSIANQIGCEALGVDPDFTQDFTVPVAAGQTYFVFVDSYWDGGGNPNFVGGPYDLNIEITSP